LDGRRAGKIGRIHVSKFQLCTQTSGGRSSDVEKPRSRERKRTAGEGKRPDRACRNLGASQTEYVISIDGGRQAKENEWNKASTSYTEKAGDKGHRNPTRKTQIYTGFHKP